MGGSGFYDLIARQSILNKNEISGLSGNALLYDSYVSLNNIPTNRWWERAILADVSSACAGVASLGIGGLIGGALTPGVNVAILGGLGLGIATGSAMGCLF